MKKIKKLPFVVFTFLIFNLTVNSQNSRMHVPSGYDISQDDFSHGEIDTISYYSTTLCTNRKAEIYTPTEYSMNKKYLMLYILYGIGSKEYKWLSGGHPGIILNNLYTEKN